MHRQQEADSQEIKPINQKHPKTLVGGQRDRSVPNRRYKNSGSHPAITANTAYNRLAPCLGAEVCTPSFLCAAYVQIATTKFGEEAPPFQRFTWSWSETVLNSAAWCILHQSSRLTEACCRRCLTFGCLA